MKKIIILYTVFPAVLVCFHLFLFNSSWSLPSESAMIKILNLVSQQFNKPTINSEDDYLVIDTSYSTEAIEITTNYGTPGKEHITSREKLSLFFANLHATKIKPKFIICDLLLEQKTDFDSVLFKTIQLHPNILFPSQPESNPKQSFIIEELKDKSAPASYTTYSGSVDKLNLLDPITKEPSYTTVLLKELGIKNIECGSLICFQDGSIIPKYYYPKYFINSDDIVKKVIPLEGAINLLANGERHLIEDLFKDKILIIGNLQLDTHLTSVGKMPGSLVLYNGYLTLKYGYNNIHWTWIVFSFVCFVILQRISTLPIKVISNKNRNQRIYAEFFASLFFITLLVFTMSIISNLIFKVYVTLIPVIVYVEVYKFTNKYLLK